MRCRRVGWSLLFLSMVLLPACAQLQGPALSDLMSNFFSAEDSEAVEVAIEAILESDTDVQDLAQSLRKGRIYASDVATGWMIREIEGLDGRLRPYHVYVPTDYDPASSYVVFFDLHGAVSSLPQPAEYLIDRRRMWENGAEAHGWILIVPHGDKDASWFSANGRANLLGQLAFVKRQYNVDENKVFVSGFSDGGSGAYWQAFHDPTPWAGMISFHGHPGVGGFGPYQSYPRNLLNRPIRATTGELDTLYPPSEILTFVELFHQLGVDLDWVVYASAHDMSFLPVEAEQTVEFVSRISRDPHRSEIVWETSSTDVGRCDWVRIDDIADVGNNADFADINLAEAPERIVFGASLAYHGDNLFTVAGLEIGSTARILGIRNGDQILRINEYEVLTQADLTLALQGDKPGDPVEVEIVRDGETMILTGTIPAGEVIFRRDYPTASIRVVATGNTIDVTASHVSQYTLFLSSEQFDLSRPITVTTNGDSSFSAQVDLDPRFMLEQVAKDNDRKAVYEARIEIEVLRAL